MSCVTDLTCLMGTFVNRDLRVDIGASQSGSGEDMSGLLRLL